MKRITNFKKIHSRLQEGIRRKGRAHKNRKKALEKESHQYSLRLKREEETNKDQKNKEKASLKR